MANIEEFTNLINSDDFSFIMYKGPLILVSNKEALKNNPSPNCAHDATRLLISLFKFYSLCDISYKSLKNIIVSEITKCNTNKSWFIGDFYKSLYLIFLDTLMGCIRKYQYDNKQMESVMVNCCPIVPYENNIITPVKITEIKDIFKENKNFDKTLLTLLIKFPYEIFEHTNYVLYDESDEYTAVFKINEEQAFDDSVEKYYLLARNMYFTSHEGNLKSLESQVYTLFENTSMTDKISALESLITDETISNFENGTFIQAAKAKFDKIESATKMLSLHTDYKDFNLDILTAFIYKERIYKPNKYVNSLFLSKIDKSIKPTYLKDDLMVCEISEDYLVAPVQDLSADYKIKLITLDKVGQIRILEDDGSFYTSNF